jgi:hypothetical protein
MHNRIKLFGDLDRDVDLTLGDVRKHKSGLVDLQYKVQ